MHLQMNRVVQRAGREISPREKCGKGLGGRKEFLTCLTFE